MICVRCTLLALNDAILILILIIYYDYYSDFYRSTIVRYLWKFFFFIFVQSFLFRYSIFLCCVQQNICSIFNILNFTVNFETMFYAKLLFIAFSFFLNIYIYRYIWLLLSSLLSFWRFSVVAFQNTFSIWRAHSYKFIHFDKQDVHEYSGSYVRYMAIKRNEITTKIATEKILPHQSIKALIFSICFLFFIFVVAILQRRRKQCYSIHCHLDSAKIINEACIIYDRTALHKRKEWWRP